MEEIEVFCLLYVQIVKTIKVVISKVISKNEYFLSLGSDYLNRKSATFLFSENTNIAQKE